MNWRGEREGQSDPRDYLAQRILKGLAQPGAHRALVDLTNWTLLKWLDDPARSSTGASAWQAITLCIPTIVPR